MEALEDHALRSATAVVTVCTSLTQAVRERAPQARVFQVEDPPLVDAAPRVPDAQLLFMGGEPRQIEALRLRASGLGAGERCLFSGKRPPYELPAFLAVADVLVSPRIQGENTPFKVFTYLASGKPLVATRISTHTQLLDDSLAFLVEPTADGLAAGIRQGLERPDEARARADRGRALIEREYSAARYQEKVAAAYAAIGVIRGVGPSGVS